MKRFIDVKEYKTCETPNDIMKKMASKYKFVFLADEESCKGEILMLMQGGTSIKLRQKCGIVPLKYNKSAAKLSKIPEGLDS